MARPPVEVPLSPREREVLTLIAQGSTTKEIASELGISFGAIDTHRTNLMRKLKIRNVAGLVGYAFRAGLDRRAPLGASMRLTRESCPERRVAEAVCV